MKRINFTAIKVLFLKKYVDIEIVLVSRKISLGEKNYKYFIGYLNNDDRVKPVHMILPKTSAYVKRYDGQTKWMHFLFEDDGLLKKYDTIWSKVNADIKNEFDSEPVYNKKNKIQNKISW